MNRLFNGIAAFAFALTTILSPFTSPTANANRYNNQAENKHKIVYDHPQPVPSGFMPEFGKVDFPALPTAAHPTSGPTMQPTVTSAVPSPVTQTMDVTHTVVQEAMTPTADITFIQNADVNEEVPTITLEETAPVEAASIQNQLEAERQERIRHLDAAIVEAIANPHAYTKEQRREWVAQLVDEMVVEGSDEFKKSLISLIFSESGFGNDPKQKVRGRWHWNWSSNLRDGLNLFNAKGVGTAGYDYKPDNELRNGRLVMEPSYFRTYHRPSESIADALKWFKTNPDYDGIYSVQSSRQFANILKRAHWATSPDVIQEFLDVRKHWPIDALYASVQ